MYIDLKGATIADKAGVTWVDIAPTACALLHNRLPGDAQINAAKELHELASALDILHQQRAGGGGGAVQPDSPPPASSFARRLATQIFERETRPQVFDTVAFNPASIYGVITYYVGAAAAVLYQDIKVVLVNQF